MPDLPPEGGVFSIRVLISNVDYLANWSTVVAVAGVSSIFASIKDKLTGAAMMLSFVASSLLAMCGWPMMLQYGYGHIGAGLVFALICGLAGMTILLTMLRVVRRLYDRAPDIGDGIARRAGAHEGAQKDDGKGG